MAAMAPSPQIANIPFLYRIYFQTIDPLLALSGSYLALSNGPKYIHSVAPASILPKPSNPSSRSPSSTTTTSIETLLLHQISALYLYIALVSALVLRTTTEIPVWNALETSFAVCDVGHLAGMWYAMGTREFLDVRKWRGEEWVNLGILWGGLALRVAFLVGVEW
jgi:hypothetical protein